MKTAPGVPVESVDAAGHTEGKAQQKNVGA